MKNKKILITGSLGLIGFETTLFFLEKGFDVIGIDNNLREKIFNINTQYKDKLSFLQNSHRKNYLHYKYDIRDKNKIDDLFKTYGKNLYVIVHTAAQTSHDWSIKDPFLDFSVNSQGTLNLLESFRTFSPHSTFIFTSTNKVYGDLINSFDFKEYTNRYDLPQKHLHFEGIDEKFSIDQSMHSLFGVSKTSADLMVQEYGRYFSLKTGVFRLGVITGGGQSASFYQGFLSYMIEKLINNEKFSIIGYKGKQVRDILHAKDAAKAFYLFSQKPGVGEVFNLGGGRKNSFSIKELIKKSKSLSGRVLRTEYTKTPRNGDHKWWITDISKFKKSFPEWKPSVNIDDILSEIYKTYESR